MMTEEPYFEEIETYCPKTRLQVQLMLQAAKEPKGDLISGVPVSCGSEKGCSKGAKCLLLAVRICTVRKRR